MGARIQMHGLLDEIRPPVDSIRSVDPHAKSWIECIGCLFLSAIAKLTEKVNDLASRGRHRDIELTA
jgi:hypothetical protein